MRRPISHTQLPLISRRAAIAGALTAPLALPAMARDPHPVWLDQWRVARAAVNKHPNDADTHPLWPQFEALEQRILQTPALTGAGVAAQLTLLAEDQALGLQDATHALQRAVALLGRI